MKPRILLIIHMPPPVHGAAMMGKYIHDSKVVNEVFDCQYINPTTAKNLEDISKFRIGKVFDIFRLLQRIRKEVKEIKPNLVYFTANSAGVAFYKDFLIVQLLKRLGCKIIIHYHNKGVATRQDRWLDNRLYKRFFQGIKVILLAEALYTDIKKYIKRDNVYVCANGIPPSENTPIVHKQDDNLPLRLLYLSNMMATKGVWDLVEACKILKEREVSFSCDFVGGWKDITEEAFQQAIKSARLGDNIHAHGPKYREEKSPFWRQADIFVFPTYYPNECFPLVLMEAMEQGKACIATDEGGIPDIIESDKTGILVPKHSPVAIANAIEQLVHHRELCQEMGEAGRERFLQEFTLDKFERRITKILKDCIAK